MALMMAAETRIKKVKQALANGEGCRVLPFQHLLFQLSTGTSPKDGFATNQFSVTDRVNFLYDLSPITMSQSKKNGVVFCIFYHSSLCDFKGAKTPTMPFLSIVPAVLLEALTKTKPWKWIPINVMGNMIQWAIPSHTRAPPRDF
ncbi:hypothetical protein NC651_034589 [Populus alba x Populus x berolinensis]|nr:hypothetical protein NC651_034589 [Populus alba x Populus x berolinensis]